MNYEAAKLAILPQLSISTALLASEVPQADASGKGAEWIKVTPRGPAQTRDGRRYSFTPETLVAQFKAGNVDIPADLNHALALKAVQGEGVEAIGWAKEIEARPDGTYARMEWLDAGKAVLAARTHRYVSPTFHHDEAGEATWLHSISLLAAPALSMPALAAAVPGGATPAPASIQAALGLDPSADEPACLAAIGELRTAFVPMSLYADAIAMLNATQASLTAQRSDVRSAGVNALLEGALKAGKIVPAERAHYQALCATEAGFASVSLLFAAKPAASFMRPSGLDGQHPRDGAAENPEALAARASRYRQAQEAAGMPTSQVDAISFCHANPAAGR